MRDRLIELVRNAPKIEFPSGSRAQGKTYQTAKNLADHLIANGVVVFPCKVGDTAWIVYTPRYPANPSDKGKWFMREDGVQRLIYGAKGISIETWNMGTMSAKEIGKKLFFTKEDAEKALAERSGQ